MPDDLAIQKISDADLPPDWYAPVAPESTKDFGTNWANSQSSVVLSVPSAIVPEERNYLLNPHRPEFVRIRFSPPRPFVFDPRLRKKRSFVARRRHVAARPRLSRVALPPTRADVVDI
jgi:RES domain-containing protein